MRCPYKPGMSLQEAERELGVSRVIRLASNENPLGPSPRARALLRDGALTTQLSAYPDTNAQRLRGTLADHLGHDEREVIVGSGSAEIARLLSECFLSAGDEVLLPDPTFGFYELVARIAGATPVLVPTLPDLRVDLEALRARVSACTKLIFLANPNNPTGIALPTDEVERFAAALPSHVLLVVDAAYSHYVATDDYAAGLARLRRLERVVVLETFSKAHGLAGLRCGYGVARPPVIAGLSKLRTPFSVNTIAQAAALEALLDHDHLAATVAHNRTEIRYLEESFAAMGLSTVPSEANFLLVRLPVRDGLSIAAQVATRLGRKGILVRHFPHPAIDDMLRISTGLHEHNVACVEALADLLRLPPPGAI